MYNYPLYYIHTASYKNPGCHPNPVRQEQKLYIQQAKDLVADKLTKFKVNGNKTEHLTEKSWLVHLTGSTDPITVNICFDLDRFKREYSNYFWKLTRDSTKSKMSVFADILFTDKFVVDLSVLKCRGKLCNTKLLTTDSINPLIIEDELEELEVSSLPLGDVIYQVITTDVLLSATTNALDSKALKVFYLNNCYYQPKQILHMCEDAYLTVNAVLDSNGNKYLLTTEDDDYLALLEAYNSVLGCVRKINYAHLQYAHIEYCDLFS